MTFTFDPLTVQVPAMWYFMGTTLPPTLKMVRLWCILCLGLWGLVTLTSDLKTGPEIIWQMSNIYVNFRPSRAFCWVRSRRGTNRRTDWVQREMCPLRIKIIMINNKKHKTQLIFYYLLHTWATTDNKITFNHIQITSTTEWHRNNVVTLKREQWHRGQTNWLVCFSC